MSDKFEIFLVAIPGLEQLLCEEAREKGFGGAKVIEGGVSFDGNWQDVWRANRKLRGASAVLARIASFHANHLAQLDKRARAVPWKKILRADVPVSVEASCKRSKIYHSGAAAQRVATAIKEELGTTIVDDADIAIKLRIDKDLCVISIDTSGELLHRRGSKQAMAKAPMRETMAALMLRACGYSGKETVVDPMCGSGTFIIEAAEIAAGLNPGRNRSFAFEQLANYENPLPSRERVARNAPGEGSLKFYGSDRNPGAIKAASANATRAGVTDITSFETKPVSALTPPTGLPGLVVVNPPYGTRIGDKKPLLDLYASFGNVMRERFIGWRIGMITADDKLARATALKFEGQALTALHGGLRVKLYRTGPITPNP